MTLFTLKSKVKDYEINLQEKMDRLNELSIANEELERCLKEKDESNFMLTNHNKDLETQLNMTENKFKQDYEKVIDKALFYMPFSLKLSQLFLTNQPFKKISQLQEDINTLLQSSKSQTDVINELKEKLNESESNLKKEFNLVENWTLEKEVK
jgi:Mg2+ and Co2+ transporter CorA